MIPHLERPVSPRLSPRKSILKSNSRLLSDNVAKLKTAAIASATKPPNSLPKKLRGVLGKSHFPVNSKLEKELQLKSKTVSFHLSPTPAFDTT